VTDGVRDVPRGLPCRVRINLAEQRPVQYLTCLSSYRTVLNATKQNEAGPLALYAPALPVEPR
jgi:hypothetical protein